MSYKFAKGLLWLQLAVLLVGTQMPNAWRVAALAELHVGMGLSSWAHFVLFAGMAILALVRPLAWPLWRVLGLALCLALVSEALQLLAIDRHPRWLDVGIDMAGALIGAAVARVIRNKG